MRFARLPGIVLLIASLAATGCISIDLPNGQGPLHQERVFGEGGPKILMVDIDGALSTQPERGTLGLSSKDALPARVRQQLELASEDSDIRALLLRINSPGGTVIASELIYQEIQRYREETGLPVVAQLMGVAASGGYYVAMAADQVRAYPSTLTGSIGVIFFGLNLTGLMEKVGVSNQTLVTGPFKDAGSPLRPMRPEEREQLASVSADLFDGFLDVVERGRPKLDRARIEELADGRIYSAGQALEAGLVDEIGDLQSAVEVAKRAAGVEGEVQVVVYARPGREPENLFSAVSSPPGSRAGWGSVLASPGFFYLWSPGLDPVALGPMLTTP
jgi:protease-4